MPIIRSLEIINERALTLSNYEKEARKNINGNGDIAIIYNKRTLMKKNLRNNNQQELAKHQLRVENGVKKLG